MKLSNSNEAGRKAGERRGESGSAGSILLLLILAGIGFLVLREVIGGPPEAHLSQELKGIGRSTTVSVISSDGRGLRSLEVSLEQGGQAIPVFSQVYGDRWHLWSSEPAEITQELQMGTTHQEVLRDGQATLRIRARNWRLFGGETVLEQPIVVRSRPPSLEVLSGLLYVNQGGSELVLYRVSDSAVESGVRVGDYFFPGYPVPGGQPGEHVALFAYPPDVPSGVTAQVVARDEIENEALANFPHRLTAKRFRHRDIEISDSFIQSTVPAILSNSPEVTDEGDPLKNFLLVNGKLREMNRARIAEMARQTSPTPLWEGAFLQLTNSAVESQFADYRSYIYQGSKVDEQVHMGFDLASVQHAPVIAANSGRVVFAQYLGIFGNTIILDHGLGLQSLYAHLSSFGVKPGDMVAKGDVIAQTGSTGLAGGDHLHFATLLGGVEVNSVEWWDPLWIEQHILPKLPAAKLPAQKSSDETPVSSGA
jgi:murein DD-endopeptidase MepM/ murein hydrolase activator NlpD